MMLHQVQKSLTDDRAISPLKDLILSVNLKELCNQSKTYYATTKERLDPPRILPPLPNMDIGRPPIPTDSIYAIG